MSLFLAFAVTICNVVNEDLPLFYGLLANLMVAVGSLLGQGAQTSIVKNSGGR